MITVLSASVCVTCAVLAALTLAAHRRRVGRHPIGSTTPQRDAFAIENLHALVDASRESSAAVFARLDRSLREFDPLIDAFLAFIPIGDELRCIYTGGARTAHFQELRMRRDAEHALPAKAALAGHRAVLTISGGGVIPTDRRGLAVPLIDPSGLRAVVYVSSPSERAFAHEDCVVQAIEHALSPYAIAFERELDHADATYDALTGLLTPRAFRARLHAETQRCRRNAVMTLWFIDTDHFKRVNDEFGHSSGDRVLQEMAELLRVHTVRDVDAIGRNGGDEFCALIREAQKTLAIERAQAYCDAVRAHDFGVPVRITASIGVAALPFDAETPNDLLEVADAAMYHSKRVGRDQVSFAVNGPNFEVYR